jgi:flagellar motility protein MotE (MotC chaperone)
MRIARLVVMLGLGVKLLVLGAWWWNAVAPAYAAKGGESTSAAGTEVPGDLLARSRGFRDLLEAVHQRGVDLDQREQAVAARESALKTLEKTIADEVTRLEGLTRPAGGAAAPAAADGSVSPLPAAGGVGVTKIYETMKPDEAGPIFDKLDDATATAILGRMKERQIGAILAAMTRDRAVQLTRLLSHGGSGGHE